MKVSEERIISINLGQSFPSSQLLKKIGIGQKKDWHRTKKKDWHMTFNEDRQGNCQSPHVQFTLK